MKHYRCIHKRYNAQGTLVTHHVVTFSGYTIKCVKAQATVRFGLQGWHAWACTANGTHQRTHTPSPKRPFRGILTLEPIQQLHRAR